MLELKSQHPAGEHFLGNGSPCVLNLVPSTFTSRPTGANLKMTVTRRQNVNISVKSKLWTQVQTVPMA